MTAPITIRKNSKEEVRLGIEEFKGHRLVNIRVWYDAGNGEMRPGKHGLAVRLELLPEVRAALAQLAETEGQP